MALLADLAHPDGWEIALALINALQALGIAYIAARWRQVPSRRRRASRRRRPDAPSS